jgi:hypothetical protein
MSELTTKYGVHSTQIGQGEKATTGRRARGVQRAGKRQKQQSSGVDREIIPANWPVAGRTRLAKKSREWDKAYKRLSVDVTHG